MVEIDGSIIKHVAFILHAPTWDHPGYPTDLGLQVTLFNLPVVCHGMQFRVALVFLSVVVMGLGYY